MATTPKQIIDKIQSIKPSILSDQDILELINELEDKLAKSVIKEQQSTCFYRVAGQSDYPIPFPFSSITHVFINGMEIPKIQPICGIGYTKGQNGVMLLPSPSVSDQDKPGLCIISIKEPIPYTMETLDTPLLLDSRYTDVYLYHILSRIALAEDDIAHLDNYVTLYSAALKEFAGEMFANRPLSIGSDAIYQNLW